MNAVAGALSLAPGSELELDGLRWTVGEFEPQLGRLTLVAGDGREMPTSVGAVINHPGAFRMRRGRRMRRSERPASASQWRI